MRNFFLRLEVPYELKNYNAGQGRHWGMTHTEKRRAFKSVQNARCFGMGAGGASLSDFARVELHSPLDFPVNLVLERVLGKGQRVWDADSVLRGSAKQLIDSIVDAGLLVDDGPKWVHLVVGTQNGSRRDDGPMTFVHFADARSTHDNPLTSLGYW